MRQLFEKIHNLKKKTIPKQKLNSDLEYVYILETVFNDINFFYKFPNYLSNKPIWPFLPKIVKKK